MQVENTSIQAPVQREICSVWDRQVDFSFSERRETVKVKAERGTIRQLLGDEHFPLQDVQFQAVGAENGFSPFRFRNGYRRMENAKTASMVVLDYDELTHSQEVMLFAALDQTGLAYVAHTTKSHGQYKPKRDSFFCCWRIVLPLETPTSPEDYVATVNALLSRLPIECKVDPMVKVVVQRWTFPCARARSIAKGEAKFRHQDGHLLQTVKAPILSLVPPPSIPNCTMEQLKMKLFNAHSRAPEIRAATESVLKGEALPFENGRPQLLWLRTLTSIARITGCDADQLLSLVTPSINAGILGGSHVTLKSVGSQIRRAIESVRTSPSTFVPMESKALGPARGPMAEARIFQFIKTRLEPVPVGEQKIAGQALYDHYRAWIEGGGGRACSNVIFAKVLKLAGIRRFDSDNHSSRYAVRVKSTDAVRPNGF